MGHSFVVYGYIDRAGRITRAAVAGFAPNGDAQLLDGVFFPVSARVGRTAADLTFRSEIVYRRTLTSMELQQLQRSDE